MTSDLQIVTPRLILRPPVMDDAKPISAAMTEIWRDLRATMPWAKNSDDKTWGQVQLKIRRSLMAFEQGGYPFYGFCRETGAFALACGLDYNGQAHETGFWVAKDFQGLRLAQEATNAVLRFAFEGAGVPFVRASHIKEQVVSESILLKLSFKYAGSRPQAHQNNNNGMRHDVKDYVINTPAGLPKLEVSW